MRKNDPMKFEQANFYNEEQFKKEGGFFRKGKSSIASTENMLSYININMRSLFLHFQ